MNWKGLFRLCVRETSLALSARWCGLGWGDISTAVCVSCMQKTGWTRLANVDRTWKAVLFGLAFLVVAFRATYAIRELCDGDVSAILAFPLTVIVPTFAFFYVGQLKNMISEEGALMQLGVMVQLILILSLPSFALYIFLGFPVVFVVVEIFETKTPKEIRNWIKGHILT